MKCGRAASRLQDLSFKMPFSRILWCKLLSNHHFSLPFGNIVGVMPGSQFPDINYEPLRSTSLPHAHEGKFCEEIGDTMNTCTLREQFHFSSVFYKPVLDFFFFFPIVKAVKGSLLHSGILIVENFKNRIVTQKKKKKRDIPKVFHLWAPQS